MNEYSSQFLSRPVLCVKEVVELERRIEDAGTPIYDLMNRAGLSVAEWIRDNLKPPGHVVVFSGSGNNGGDGWVIADYLVSWGYEVSLVTARPAEALKAEPARMTALEVTVKELTQLSVYVDPDENLVVELTSRAALIVDAILGIGFDGSVVREPYSQWIQAINAAKSDNSNLIVVAVDVPSGLSAETGKASVTTVYADTTITMIAYKPGLLMKGSKQYCGDIHLANIASLDGLL